jgi:hypothetical protein
MAKRGYGRLTGIIIGLRRRVGKRDDAVDCTPSSVHRRVMAGTLVETHAHVLSCRRILELESLGDGAVSAGSFGLTEPSSP